ncbi:unnamed protein product, partial [Cladocopium goreaui]
QQWHGLSQPTAGRTKLWHHHNDASCTRNAQLCHGGLSRLCSKLCGAEPP